MIFYGILDSSEYMKMFWKNEWKFNFEIKKIKLILSVLLKAKLNNK